MYENGGISKPATMGESMTFKILSSAFRDGETIPARYTCTGEDISPPLAWKEVPENTRSLALIVDDPDAPDPKAPRMTWVHWLLYDIPPSITALEEAVPAGKLPPGTRQGINDWKRTGYGGPCPPVGRHRYYFKLYALDTVLDDLGNPVKTRLENAMKGHVLAQAVLMGTYQK